ncbi:hypothetical protein [Reinekea marinisedimentorum]|uniref:Tetratricopeptide repeat protein n=1 Tax=Reinekea marinisedimentorum TaxID=230495 RepID=A0A4R3HU39_9GAMM|nr:hypothetical protein [Reinekea marinisedimentorum]TCS36727.1 hypothetical protein BCF53_1221 [Reinekea marinisedimentorum]
MNSSDSKLLKKVSQLERKLESGISETEREGYVPNKYGTYDSLLLRNKLFEMYSELVNKHPSEEYFQYLQASSYWRAKSYAEALKIYDQVILANGLYRVASLKMQSCILFEMEEFEVAEEKYELYKQEARAAGENVWREKVSDLYPDS